MKKVITYFSDFGGMPEPSSFLSDRAIFKEAYIFIPRGCIRDIVVSILPNWAKTRCWVLAKPLTGFIETFSYYLMEVSQGGGSVKPDPDQSVESILFVVEGELELVVGARKENLSPGSYTYIPPGVNWSINNDSSAPAKFHWIRKLYEKDSNLTIPDTFTVNEQSVTPKEMPNEPRWKTSRFVEPTDLRHDMHVNIVSFEPGSSIPFPETHVMEHAIYILQGRGTYYLNGDWVDVEAGDFMALRAFCPQACQALGDEPFRYLLYKNVNRHISLSS